MKITAIKRWENGRNEEKEFDESAFLQMIAWFRESPEAGISTFASNPDRDHQIWEMVAAEFAND